MTGEKHGEKVKGAILAAGLALWLAEGQGAVSARRIGRHLGMTHGGVLYHFGDAAALGHAIACEAVRTRCAVIVPQLIAARHAAVTDLSAADRRRYLAGC